MANMTDKFKELVDGIMLEPPEELSLCPGFALFGIKKGNKDFLPEFTFMHSLRFTFQGDRCLVLCKARGLC